MFYTTKLQIVIIKTNKDKIYISRIFQASFNHNHKKRKDSLETRAVLLIFSLELEISGVTVQSIHQNSEKWQLFLGTAQ